MTNDEQTLRHAHSILEDKQRMMTQYRYLFTDEEREANGIAILAIENQMEQLESRGTRAVREMTNLEKWKNKIAEAKDGFELMETIRILLRKYHDNLCFYVNKECDGDCKGCEVMWFDMEAKE